MDDRIVAFSSLLRRNGVRVSLSEDMDALRALDLLGIEDGAAFRNALRTTLIKRAEDIRTFDRLFDLFFLGLGASLKEAERDIMDKMGLSPGEYRELLDEIRRWLDRLDGKISAFARALLAGHDAEIERLFMDAWAGEDFGALQDSFEAGDASWRLAIRLDLARVGREIEVFRSMAGRLGADSETLERISRYMEERLKYLDDLVRRFVKRALDKKDSAARTRHEYLFQKSFAFYTEEDIRRMNEVVARLARRLKNLLSIRRKRARHGRFNVKDTLRKNLQYGGVPFRIRLDRRRREKPQVMVLCDISDSVLNASRFLLQFVYSVQELYSKVRSFVFVSDVGEVTELFEENDIHSAVDKALKGDVINVFTHSNFGNAFKVFYEKYRSGISAKTTFLIIGDGRNNYNIPNEWVLKEIRRKAKHLIWLNPESRLTWGLGDSEMPRYTQHCHLVEECRNIRQLWSVIDRIAS